jgi:hypothetical protein
MNNIIYKKIMDGTNLDSDTSHIIADYVESDYLEIIRKKINNGEFMPELKYVDLLKNVSEKIINHIIEEKLAGQFNLTYLEKEKIIYSINKCMCCNFYCCLWLFTCGMSCCCVSKGVAKNYDLTNFHYLTHKDEQELIDNTWKYLKIWDMDYLSKVFKITIKRTLNSNTYELENITTGYDKYIYDFIELNIEMIKKAVYATMRYKLKLIGNETIEVV